MGENPLQLKPTKLALEPLSMGDLTPQVHQLLMLLLMAESRPLDATMLKRVAKSLQLLLSISKPKPPYATKPLQLFVADPAPLKSLLVVMTDVGKRFAAVG
ncbi:hypothetical protein PPTG_08873 [Phytophthora nicotianae INRA-310]|uniref:Uncharacterized protein n=1 Tax=Phytophthora nicotianae (strain INRA-310) TaxID=761204 RepID=W2QI53_PHYN3|nr:hypothetical protein PPTG_08873 [Phytophthora nicotianae INRA-310]ETN12838.1 hypothetical protein PPTG_08873 [Phytophthora nicotianae INRA-310]